MADLLAIVFPVFALIGLGAFAASAKLLPSPVGDGLGAFTYVCALPALLFRTLASAELPGTIPYGYWAAYFGALLIVWTAGQAMARHLFGVPTREAAIAGLGVAQANTVMIGIPVILNAYGPAAAVPIAFLIGLNLPVTMTLATFLFEADGKSRRAAALALLRGLATHPILLAILAGLIANRLGLKPPALIDAPLAMLAATAIPCALVGLGMSLARHGFGERAGLVVAVSALKLLAMPGIVLGLGTVLKLEPLFLGAAVIFASAPVGINVYIFAARYQTGVSLASGAIAFSTLAAVVTTTFWLWVLGLG